MHSLYIEQLCERPRPEGRSGQSWSRILNTYQVSFETHLASLTTMAVSDDDDVDLGDPGPQVAAGPVLPQAAQAAQAAQAMQAAQAAQAAATNPFSPAHGGANNEQRLVQVLESVTMLLQNQAATSAAALSNRTAVTGKDLSKIIKQPEPFSPKDRDAELSMWPAWSWQFEQWLGCVNRDFVQDIARIRANLSVPIVQTALTAAEQERSQLLLGILAGLMHDKGCRMLRTIPASCGFEGYRRLMQDLTPSSRSRLLALIQMIHSWPAFNMKLGLMQQLAKFESAVQEYESLSNSQMSEDAKLASVLKCLSGQLKMQAMVHVTENSTYADLRQLIQRWDSGQARWDGALASAYGIPTSRNPNDTSAPMEIDRLQKGKKGGKGDKGKGKGHAKGSGSWDTKGKGQGGNSKGKGKGQTSSGKGDKLCNFCKKPGHFKRDCFAWKRFQQAQGSVQQVAKDTSVPQGALASTASSSAASASSLAASSSRKVNRLEFVVPEEYPVIPMYDDDDEDDIDLTVFSEWYDDDDEAYAVCAVHYDMTATDSDGDWMRCGVQSEDSCNESNRSNSNDDPITTESPGFSASVACQDQVPCSGHVCAVVSSLSFDPQDASAGDPVEMIIDSGADESCLPLSMDLLGQSLGRAGPSFCDAQGHPLQVHDRRQCVLQFLNLDQQVKTFKESCLVSSVNSPLFAVGKLYKLGWGTFWCGDQFVLGLPGKPSTYIPCSFRHNSIVAQGWIRRVHVPSPSHESAAASAVPRASLSPSPMQVRMLAKLGRVLERLVRDATYFQELVPGIWGIQVDSDCFIDVSEALPNEGLQYRTTLALQNGRWKVLELSENIDQLESPSC